ncbi:MAG TPA: magnesium transporter [Opitutaceae bacterium]|nr:magnesium transporter [Opitutaceae bacterium]
MHLSAPAAKNQSSLRIEQLVEPALAVFPPETTADEAIEVVRRLATKHFFTYAYVADAGGRLVGVVTMRDLLLAGRAQRLAEFMLRDPFFLRPETPLMEAMRLTLNRHFPYYPVCDDKGVLVGMVRGATLFEKEAVEISAQPGELVGVAREERTASSWWLSLRFRHPWLQINLLTTFLAAGVVGAFEHTINKTVALAVFLPVMMGQAANTGCQALAVALRGLTLGELKPGREKALVLKEAFVGLCNGALTGLTAGAGMFGYARWKGTPASPLRLGGVVFFAMTGACTVSGVCGALTPLVLKKFGADPASASSILLTTITDVVSMGLFLTLAAWWLL